MLPGSTPVAKCRRSKEETPALQTGFAGQPKITLVTSLPLRSVANGDRSMTGDTTASLSRLYAIFAEQQIEITAAL
jgi:hypothetical protein